MSSEHTNAASAPKLVAEIISIGDEICCGAILDTNAPFLSESLAEIGVRTLYHSTIGDDADAMEAAFALAFHRADVVVCTGGLGPTQDDLTRQIAAKVLDVELEFDQRSFDHTSELFQRRGRVMPESNRIQAYFPEGARIIYNPNGTAPGFIIESTPSKLPQFESSFIKLKGAEDERPFIALFFPGVPAEMKEMWRGENGRAAVERFVQENSESKRVYRTKLIHSFGLGESAVEAKLPNLIARDHFPPVGITAKNSVITLRIFAEGATDAVCDEQIRDISKIIYDAIGDYIFGEDSDTYSLVFSHILRAQSLKVGVLEWGTQGALSQIIEPDVLAFGEVFGDSNSDRQLFTDLFGDSFAEPEENRRVSAASETFGNSFYIETKASNALVEFCQARANERQTDFFLAIGPYPTAREDVNSAPHDSANARGVDVVFVDCRPRDAWRVRRETFVFGGQPAMIDALFCNRAFSILLKNH